jgi:hypothetical protein
MSAVISENFILPAALAVYPIISEIAPGKEEAVRFPGAAVRQDKKRVARLRG